MKVELSILYEITNVDSLIAGAIEAGLDLTDIPHDDAARVRRIMELWVPVFPKTIGHEVATDIQVF